MIITEQKPLQEILQALKQYNKIFIVGCGECSTTCKTGGSDEIAGMKQELEKAGKNITGTCLPESPCVAGKIKTELAKNMKVLRETECFLVLSCGLGVQSVKENDRLGLAVMPGCNTICGAIMDAQGNFYEKCSMCSECILDKTAGFCPVTLCSKGLLNGPCGGMNKGKCEVDKERDCVWVAIYKQLEKMNELDNIKQIMEPKDHKKTLKPRKRLMAVK